jgi:hypothetical protein
MTLETTLLSARYLHGLMRRCDKAKIACRSNLSPMLPIALPIHERTILGLTRFLARQPTNSVKLCVTPFPIHPPMGTLFCSPRLSESVWSR